MKTGFSLCGNTTQGKPCSGPVLALYVRDCSVGKKKLGRNPRSDQDLCKKGNKSPNKIWKVNERK